MNGFNLPLLCFCAFCGLYPYANSTYPFCVLNWLSPVVPRSWLKSHFVFLCLLWLVPLRQFNIVLTAVFYAIEGFVRFSECVFRRFGHAVVNADRYRAFCVLGYGAV